MHNLDRALSDIATIRDQLARDTLFRGLGPATLAASGVLAGLAAFFQPLFVAEPARDIFVYLALWTSTALLAAAMIGTEAVRRAHRIHCGLADDMLRTAIEQFLPAALAAAALSVVIATCAPQAAWLLPGLWQILMSLGVFASCRSLPRPILIVAFWYLATGLVCVAASHATVAMAPWMMGVPFGVGQLLAALLLRSSFGGSHVRA